jgi:hypothetical protein
MECEKHDPDRENDLTALERRLAAWRPAAGAVDRDRMLFDAGRAAARAEDRVRVWRLATAASIIVIATLGGLLAHERSQRPALEPSAAVRTSPPDPWPSTLKSARSVTIESSGPNSYQVLTSRLVSGARDLSSFDVELEPEPARPPTTSSKPTPHAEPLRPRDLQRVLDL